MRYVYLLIGALLASGMLLAKDVTIELHLYDLRYGLLRFFLIAFDRERFSIEICNIVVTFWWKIRERLETRIPTPEEQEEYDKAQKAFQTREERKERLWQKYLKKNPFDKEAQAIEDTCQAHTVRISPSKPNIRE